MKASVHFAPVAEHSARTNLRSFIEHARKVNALGVKDWEAVQWDITNIFPRKARLAPVRINWTDLDSKKGGTEAAQRNVPLPSPFVDFAKAYLSERHALQPAYGIESASLMALRVLERALKQIRGTGDVTQVDANVLNAATTLAREKWATSTAALVGQKLQHLSVFLTENRLTDLTLTWKSPLRHDSSDGLFRVGPEADERRKRRLPTDEVMQAIAKAFDLATEPRDVLTSSVVALLVCSPDRIGEVLNLERDALVVATLDGKPTVGFRWLPEKGGKPMVKPVPPVMQDVARKAYERLLAATTVGNEMVRWYAKHPDKMFLPNELEHIRGRDLLSVAEARDLLGFSSTTHVHTMLGQLQSEDTTDLPPRGMVRFSDVEKFVLSALPSDFPIMDRDSGLSYVDALLVVPVRFFKGGAPSRVMFMRVTYDHLMRQLGGNRDAKNSLFGRLELRSPDGSYIRLRTHQIRHWLNTIARKGGLSELDIALWSGRKVVGSNASYDNLTAQEALALVNTATQPQTEGLVEFVVREPVSRAEFDILKVKTGHVTEYGVCVHDYAMAPCQKHGTCTSCDEQVVVKGDVESNARIRHALEMTEQLHKKAIEALGNNWNGAAPWEKHHYETLMILRGLVRILDDPSVPEGSIIRLARGGAHTILQQALGESRRLSQEQRDSAVAAIRLFHSGNRRPREGEAQ